MLHSQAHRQASEMNLLSAASSVATASPCKRNVVAGLMNMEEAVFVVGWGRSALETVLPNVASKIKSHW